MTKPFEYDNFPDEITADPMKDKHNEEIFEMLTEAIKDNRYNYAQSIAGRLQDRRGYLDFRPLGSPHAGQSDDLMIQFSIRINQRDAAELGLLDLERSIIAEEAADAAERLAAKAKEMAAAADAAAEKATEARKQAQAAALAAAAAAAKK